jgi:hypothetical protein
MFGKIMEPTDRKKMVAFVQNAVEASKIMSTLMQAKAFTLAKLVDGYQEKYADINTKASSAAVTRGLLKRSSGRRHQQGGHTRLPQRYVER